MTSLHVICGLGTPNQKSWLRLCWATASIVLDLNTKLKLVSFLKILPRIASSVIELGASNPYIINTPILPIQLRRRQTSAMKLWKFCYTIVQTSKPGLSTISEPRWNFFVSVPAVFIFFRTSLTCSTGWTSPANMPKTSFFLIFGFRPL